MKNRLFIFVFIFIMGAVNVTATDAVFDYYAYRGKDKIFEQKINSRKAYRNPVLAGFYPDPSICRKGDTYYLVNSTFSYYPGIPLFTSKDMVSWVQTGNVLDRPSQLMLDKQAIRDGIYAPAISYNERNDTFYLVTTLINGFGNFVVKTKDPAKGWSDPILLPEIGGIDPSLFFDDDGKAYIVNCSAPDGKAEYDGHSAIWIHEYDLTTDRILGKGKVLVNKGSNPSKKPVWIEGPHLYKRDGQYLLMCAEGGTETNHSEVIFHADKVMGPYIPSSKNPILTQRDLPEDRENKITCTGHADIITDHRGQTWAVFLGCRPYNTDKFNTGRETFMLPVKWEDAVPVILPQSEAVPVVVQKKGGGKQNFTGNLLWRDEFDAPVIGLEWLMIRTPQSSWYSIGQGKLSIRPVEQNISEKPNPAFLGRRQQHAAFEVETSLVFTPDNERQLAGIACFQNEKYHIVFGLTLQNNKPILKVISTNDGVSTVNGTVELPVANNGHSIKLRIEGNGATYSFYASYQKDKWIPVAENVNAEILSTQIAGGFTGTVIGLYATGNQ
ncbi:MAG: glycoside hydrolase 43 family protein [Bacteroidetes bacterium]|nr:glycoside hydrolase 43 family protein [Bacteroidota bacterium]